METCFERIKDSVLSQLGEHALNLSLEEFLHLEKTLSAKDITEEQKPAIVEQMIDLVQKMMQPFLKEKRVPPQSLLLLIIGNESSIYNTKSISFDRKIGFYELLRKAFAFESRCVNNFESA